MPQNSNTMGLSPDKGLVTRKRKPKLTRKSVLKMLAVMEASQNAGTSKSAPNQTVPVTPENNADDFLQSGRTGAAKAGVKAKDPNCKEFKETKSAGPVDATVDASDVNRKKFEETGRTGRRNALADILGQHASVTSSDLPSKLEALTTNDSKSDKPKGAPGSSKS